MVKVLTTLYTCKRPIFKCHSYDILLYITIFTGLRFNFPSIPIQYSSIIVDLQKK